MNCFHIWEASAPLVQAAGLTRCSAAVPIIYRGCRYLLRLARSMTGAGLRTMPGDDSAKSGPQGGAHAVVDGYSWPADPPLIS